MKYILLDFDGVLTSDAFSQKCILEHCDENLYGVNWFDPACVQALRRITERTGAKIVICSSWRDLGERKIQKLWKHCSMPGILDENCPTTPEYILTKKDAIQHWIKDHPDDAFVILDDDELKIPNQVKTVLGRGLTMQDAEKAIALLNGIS